MKLIGDQNMKQLIRKILKEEYVKPNTRGHVQHP